MPTMAITARMIHLNVWNASGESGQAAAIAQQLKYRGFNIIATGNDPDGESPSVAIIRYGPNGKQIALTLLKQVPGATLEEDNRSDPSVDLVIGPDIKLTPRPMPPAASVLRARGFKVGTVSGSTDWFADSAVVIQYSQQGEPAAERVKLQFKNPTMQQSLSSGNTVDIYIAAKYYDTVLQPSSPSLLTSAPTPANVCTIPSPGNSAAK
jgi:hypothetical protein